MSEERLKMATSPLLSLPFPLGSGMAFSTHASASLIDVGVGFIKGVPVLAMRAVNRRIRGAVNVLRERDRSVKMCGFHAATMRASNSTLTSRIGIVTEMIDRATFRNRPYPMFERPSVSLSDAIGSTARAKLSITKGADVSLPLKTAILKTFGFGKETNFGINADRAFINSVSGSGCQPSTVMSPTPTSSVNSFSATFYGAYVHRTSIPNRLNIGG
jgi:hypothetical protein